MLAELDDLRAQVAAHEHCPARITALEQVLVAAKAVFAEVLSREAFGPKQWEIVEALRKAINNAEETEGGEHDGERAN